MSASSRRKGATAERAVAAKYRETCRECDKPSQSRGLCHSHYTAMRQRRIAEGTWDPYEPRSVEERFWEKVQRAGADDCWPWLASLDEDGYGHLRAWGRKRCAARVALVLTERLELGSSRQALHHCDNRACVNPAHLYVGTPQDNMDDNHERGRARYLRGSQLPAAKLNARAVREIRRRAAEGELQYRLAEEYGVSKQQLSKIINRKRWAWVE